MTISNVTSKSPLRNFKSAKMLSVRSIRLLSKLPSGGLGCFTDYEAEKSTHQIGNSSASEFARKQVG